MGKIIGSICISAVGMMIVYGASNRLGAGYITNANLIIIILGVLAQLGAFVMLLFGLKEFFLSEIQIELLKLTGTMPPSGKFKQCSACAEFIRIEAKKCKHCGGEDFIKE